MIRKAKSLGIVLLAICAMSAVAASAAHATEARFTCGTTEGKTCEVTVEADPNEPAWTLKTNAGNTTCTEFHAVSGSLPDGVKQSSLTLTGLELKGCELGGLVATVTSSEGCHFTLTPGNTEKEGEEPKRSTGNLELSVTTGKTCTITIKTLKCTTTIEGPQAFANSITYENVKTSGKPEEITGNVTIGEKIKYTTSAGCPGGAVTKENGVLNGKFTMRAFELKEGKTGTQTDLTLVDA